MLTVLLVLALLATIGLWLLVARRLRRATRILTTLRRETGGAAHAQVLDRAGVMFMVLPDRRMVAEAVVAAAVVVLRPAAGRAAVLVHDGSVLRPIAHGGSPSLVPEPDPVAIAALGDELHAALDAPEPVPLSDSASALLARRVWPDVEHLAVIAIPLAAAGRLHGLVVVTCEEPLGPALRSTLTVLVGTASLALEARALGEDQAQRRADTRFQSLVQHSSDVTAVIDERGMHSYVSPAARSVFGHRPEDLMALPARLFAHPDDQASFRDLVGRLTASELGTTSRLEYRLRRADGSYAQVEVVATNLLEDETVRGIVLNIRDITERKSLEELLRHQAFHDGLTGLANRELLLDRLSNALNRRRRNGQAVAVLFIDLDGFKAINDRYGHAAGDLVLVELGGRLARVLRPGDTPARLGGDEFAVVLDPAPSPAGLDEIRARICKIVEQPVKFDDTEVSVQASIGTAVARDEESAEDVLRAADMAMYAVKRQSRTG